LGQKVPLSREKLAPIVGFYVEDGWHSGCARCIEMLEFGGKGHTMGLHCTDEDVIMQFGLQKPAFASLSIHQRRLVLSAIPPDWRHP